MATYYVQLQNGCCGLIEARNDGEAQRIALREEGTSNLKGVRRATRDDVVWVKGMGGYVPASGLKMLERKEN